jgi:hypothetical protein
VGYLDDAPDESVTESTSRLRLFVAIFALALVVVAVGWWFSRPAPVSRTAAPVSTAREPSRSAAASPAPAPPTTRPEPTPRETRPRSRPAPEPAAPAVISVPAPATPLRELNVDVDVEGAMVFLDRRFLGNAPLKTTDVEAGTHQLNVSAAGYDGVARSIDIAESGPTSVTIRLKEVRLNAAVDVVHKHGMGSCQGQLTAEVTGLTFAPTNGNDGFTLPFNAIETFEIDYLKKNLRLKQKGGRTWNFESPTGAADPLFVFHRDVEKARTRLASGQ